MKYRYIIILLHLFFISGPLTFAQNKTTESDSIKYRFNPVIVTATKVQDAQRDLAASVSVIDAGMIDMSPTFSALELVKNQVPGVFITERSVMGYGVASGAAGGISIRGVGGSPVTDVLVLRDGRPDIMGLMGHPIPDAYPLDGVERIEVVRGPASFLYGTNAMGGVINIVSKKNIKDGFYTSLSGGLGNYASQNLTFRHGGKSGALDYNATAAVRKSDGHRDYSDFEGKFYTLHLGYKLSRQTSIAMNSNLSVLDIMDPGPVSTPAINNWYDLNRSGADVSLDHNSSLGTTHIKLHGNFGRHKIYDGFRSHDFTVGLMLYHNAHLWSGNTATVGFDVKQYGGDAENIIRDYNYGDFHITEYAPYLHIQQLFLTRFIASAGLRVEHHELFGYEYIPKAGLVYHLSNSSSMRVSASKGFRSPSIRELYLFPAPTPDLKPEHMWNYEIGLTQEISARLRCEGVLFQAEGSDMIRLQGKWPNFNYINSGNFTHTGYELTLHYLPLNRLHVTASWTKLDLGNETLNTPGKKLTTSLAYQVGKYKLSVNLLHARDLYGADFSQDPMDDYTVMDATARYPVMKNLGLKFSLKNLFDAHYETMYGYPMPGRTFKMDMNVNL